MRKSFYTWLMAQRQGQANSPTTQLAMHVFGETTFPKHSDNFDEVSRFLEEEASFAFNLADFDEIWEAYLAH